MKKIRSFFERIVSDVVREEIFRLERQMTKDKWEIAQLIVDIKKEKLSLDSRAFLSRANINPDEVIPKNNNK